MNYSLGNMLSRGGALNPDGLALDLQFAADKTLTARRGPTPTFTRASTATFVGSNGLIQTAAINAPRFDHDPVTLASRGLLIEESRTNLALYSEALVSNTGWSGAFASTVSGTGPNGSAAYELAESTSNVFQSFNNTGGAGGTGGTSITSGTTYTGSIFLKKISGSIDWLQITLGANGFGLSQYANINLSNGSIGNSSGGTARVQAHANGWYRVSWTVVANATTSTSLSVVIAGIQNTNGTTRTPQYTGSASNRFLAAMCQFEAGSFPTSYIPTTTASVVRSADVCSITGSDFSGFYNQSEGTLFAGVAPQPITQLAAVLLVNTNTFNNIQSISKADGGGSTSGLRWVLTQNPPLVTAATSLDEANVFAKLSMGYKSGDSALYYNNKFGSSTSSVFTSIAPTQMQIGSRDSQRFINGHISEVKYFKKRLSNEKLQSLTAP
jgi:hypothetical protein